jgi:hypothetical protein
MRTAKAATTATFSDNCFIGRLRAPHLHYYIIKQTEITTSWSLNYARNLARAKAMHMHTHQKPYFMATQKKKQKLQSILIMTIRIACFFGRYILYSNYTIDCYKKN